MGPLEEAVAAFDRLGVRDREGVARIHLAAAAANLGRLGDAETQLTAAVARMRTVGNGHGLATALRNLGELRAAEGRWQESLAYFADALPVVPRVTMRFKDEDSYDRAVVPSFFPARLEDVARLDVAEAFRPITSPRGGSTA